MPTQRQLRRPRLAVLGPGLALALTLALAACTIGDVDHLRSPRDAADPLPTGVVEPEPSVQEFSPEPEPEPVDRQARSRELLESVLKPGEKPPQFVLFSIDGAGLSPNWEEFLHAARDSDARFSALLTGLYLIADENRADYTAPGRPPGQAGIGFGGSPESIVTQVRMLNRTWREGHEIGTHYMSHFCGGDGNRWGTAGWAHELGEFFRVLEDWKQINDLPNAPDLGFPASEVKGGRTPCLEGRLGELVPAWKQFDMTWDSSLPSPVSGLAWPRQVDGIWEFYIPYAYAPPFGKMLTVFDYNFWIAFNNGKDEPATAPRLRKMIKQTYEHLYERAFEGNRAPLIVANHFNQWNGDSFNPPAIEFMEQVCGKPETVCATHAEVVEWFGRQDPAVVAQLQSLAPVAVGPAG